MSEPLFILAPPRSFTSITCCMLGQHPQLYGLPETNLFMAEQMWGWWLLSQSLHGLPGHGLLRAVAQIFWGEQNDHTIQLARSWIRKRIHRSTATVFHELAEALHPRILVEKSPAVTFDKSHLWRMQRGFPNARYLYLFRHPKDQCTSLLRLVKQFGFEEPLCTLLLAVIGDPQYRWLEQNSNIRQFLQTVSVGNKLQIRGEEFMAKPGHYLKFIVRWLGVSTDCSAIAEMMHPENSPFACFGPAGAWLGNDPSLLDRPAFHEYSKPLSSLEGPLPWRVDNTGFDERVKALARVLGYR